MDTIAVLNQDQMGHGDRALGQKILGTFLKKSIALPDFRAIVLDNAAVRPAVGRVSDMDSIVRELGRAAKVITL